MFLDIENDRKEARTANTGFASGWVIPLQQDRLCKLGTLCYYSTSVLIDSLVLVDSLVLRNPPERKARQRCA